MIRKSYLKKIVAAFLLLTILGNVVAPTMSYALTSGPTAPEATSFEPVDTTDMVNLLTGDMVYNIPLLEVPGPAGGYPLSLSYHAGIQTNEDASWVGLGWTLNPGAIARTVNGYPDDQFGAVRTRHDVNTGGERNTFTLGVGYPGAMYKLSVSNDSNQGLGLGVGFDGGFQASIGRYGSVGVGGSFRANTYGEFQANGHIGLSLMSSKGMSSIGISTNFNSVSLNASVGRTEVSVDTGIGPVGANISSNGLKPSFSLAGIGIRQTNSTAGKVTVDGWGFETPPIPVFTFFFSFGYDYYRYYSDETSNVSLIGTLNARGTFQKNPDDWAFDSYALLDPDATGVVKNYDPEKSKGGSFPAYDAYNVMAQGLGGSIQPYILDNGTLFRQNLKKMDSEGNIIGYTIKYNGPYRDSSPGIYGFTSPVNFRFKNDFSNVFTYDNSPKMKEYQGTLQFNGVSPQFSADGFNDNHLAGSKHIEYFTNQQINDGTAKQKGFIDYKPNAQRELTKYASDVSGQVGGIMITNESGVTYHYALPVYAYGQYSKSFKTGKEYDIYQEIKEGAPYAYTWFLTAVTGPDHTSRNSADDGTLGNDDWGYWVKFDYSIHNDDYVWRNPIEGTHHDIDQETEFYSYGKKEVFYLDKISTATHVAVFQKSERLDGRGVTNGVAGGFQPMAAQKNCRKVDDHGLTCEDYTIYSGTTLKLDHLLLLSKADYESGGDLVSKAVRTIDFNTDYSLTPGTTNSFPTSNINTKSGRLTLTSLKFNGKAGEDVVPAMTFEYGKNPAYNKDAFDMWGYYKPDYNSSDPDAVSRFVTSASAAQADAWSLSKVGTSTGADIQIEYESDSYQKPVLHQVQNFSVSKLTCIPSSVEYLIDLQIPGDTEFLSSYFQNLEQIDLKYLDSYLHVYQHISTNTRNCIPPGDYADDKTYFKGNEVLTIKSKGVDQNGIFYLRVSAPGIYSNHLDNYTRLLSTYTSHQTFYMCSDGSTADASGYCTVTCTHGEPAGTRCTALGTPSTCDITTNTYETHHTLLAGNITKIGSESAFEILGGGLRVRSISVKSINETKSTTFNYGLTDGTSGTSGFTSYEPGGENVARFLTTDIPDATTNDFTNFLNDRFYTTLRIAREVPGPGVLYKNVTVEEHIQHPDESVTTKLPGKKVYEFQVFDEDLVQRIGITSAPAPFTVQCFDENGDPVGPSCNPNGNEGGPPIGPIHCQDQFGNPIACDIKQSQVYTPLTLKDYTSWVGSLKKVSAYDENNNLISLTETNYLHDNKSIDQFASDLKTGFKNQGVVTQLFNEYRDVDGVSTPVFSRRDEYPLVSIGQKTTDFKTGIVTSTENLEFDFYTGNPTKTLSTDGYGNTYLSEITPAYSVTNYSGMTSAQISSGFVGMGLKVKNSKNKHMLTQSAGTMVYKVTSDYKTNPTNANKIGLVSASAQTWGTNVLALKVGAGGGTGTQPNIWRMRSSYAFVGDDNVGLQQDGLYPYSTTIAFSDWSESTGQNGWQKNSQITLYDPNSHAIEAMDVNGNYAATVMTQDQARVASTAPNAHYFEIGYSGAEEQPKSGQYVSTNELGNNIYCDLTDANNGPFWKQDMAHTGASSLLVTSGHRAFVFTTGAQNDSYHVSVWSSQQSAAIKYKVFGGLPQSASATQIGNAGGWYLFEADISGVSGYDNVEIWCEGVATSTYFDDFRVHPAKSAMTSYVYNEWGELTHILNANNLYTRYMYDGMGRLQATYQETLNKPEVMTSQVKYNYAKQ